MDIIKSVFSNTKIKIVCALCAALCVAACVQLILNHSFPDDVKITEAFAASDKVTVSECIVETTARLSFGEGSLYKSAKSFLSELNRALGYENISYEKYRGKDVMYVKASYEEEEFIVNEIVTKNILSGSTYFHGTVTLKVDSENSEDIKKTVEGVLDSFGADYITYIKINALKDGKMTVGQCKGYTDRIFSRINAESVCEGKDSGYFTRYGYSKKLTDTITADDELINVQVSYSYNEKKDVMEISVGYPVINDSY